MKLEVVTELPGLEGLRHEWQQLLMNSSDNSLPLTHEWLSAWWACFGEGAKLNICCVRDGSRLVAIAPLMVEEGKLRRVPVSLVRLMTNEASPYCDIIVSAGVDTALYAKILEIIVDNYSSDIFLLSKLPEDSKAYHLLAATRSPGYLEYPVGIKESIATPLIPIDQTWEQYFGQLSRTFRKGMRNRLNRAKRQKDFHIENLVISSSRDPAVTMMIGISKRSWKSREETDLASDERGRTFLLRIIDSFAPAGSVRIWVAWQGEVPIAYELLVDYNGVVYPLRADFDMAYGDHRPGLILMYTVLQHIFKRGRFHLYYSCAADYEYFRHWTDTKRQLYDVHIFGHGLKPQLLNWLEFAVVPKARVVRNILRSSFDSMRGLAQRPGQSRGER